MHIVSPREDGEPILEPSGEFVEVAKRKRSVDDASTFSYKSSRHVSPWSGIPNVECILLSIMRNPCAS